jgi:hypothetical protein
LEPVKISKFLKYQNKNHDPSEDKQNMMNALEQIGQFNHNEDNVEILKTVKITFIHHEELLRSSVFEKYTDMVSIDMEVRKLETELGNVYITIHNLELSGASMTTEKFELLRKFEELSIKLREKKLLRKSYIKMYDEVVKAADELNELIDIVTAYISKKDLSKEDAAVIIKFINEYY